MTFTTTLMEVLIPLAAENGGGSTDGFWLDLISLIVLAALVITAIGIALNLVGSLVEIIIYAIILFVVIAIIFIGIDFLEIEGAVDALEEIVGSIDWPFDG